jgi:IclR family mhp operon transcriptional activator
MVVRYSTMARSPHAHVKSTINKRLSLTERAHGRAYLAFCSPAEREKLLHEIAEHQGCSAPAVSDHGKLLWALNAARRAGYAKRSVDLDPRTSSIAAPIIVGKIVRATLGLTFFSVAVDKEAEAALGRRLIEAATTVADALAEIGDRTCFR